MAERSLPNTLIIMSDDQGPWAMNCAGTPELDTPTLDPLAAKGMRFDHCFCASPVCSVSAGKGQVDLVAPKGDGRIAFV